MSADEKSIAGLPGKKISWGVRLAVLLGALFGFAFAVELGRISGSRAGTGAAPQGHKDDRTTEVSPEQKAVLNSLAATLNQEFGSVDGYPRMVLGPCGPFALEFVMVWNTRAAGEAKIAYVMNADRSWCYHVVVRLPDGNYFDGGYGVMTGKELTARFEGSVIDLPQEFDLLELMERTSGLFQKYEHFPDYDHRKVRKMILEHADRLFAPSAPRLGQPSS